MAIVAAVLLSTLALHADTVTYQTDPVVPTTRDAVTLLISGSWHVACPPDEIRSDVSGHAITYTLFVKECAQTVFATPFTAKHTLGPLPAGIYTVKARYETPFFSTDSAVEQPPLIVRDVSSPLTVLTPDLMPTMTRVSLHDEAYVCPPAAVICPPATVRVGNVETTNVILVTSNDFIATFPAPLPPGTYDVSLSSGGHTETGVAALTVIDPAQPPAAQLRSIEPVFIPVVFSGPGAFGSQWTTEIAVTNADVVPVDFFESPFGDVPLQPGETRVITTSLVGQRTDGMFLYLPRDESRSLQFNALVRDLSRQSESLGTELPIVRESQFFHQRFNLMNVPTDPRFRSALRVYSFDKTPVSWRIFRMGETVPLVEDSAGATVAISDLVAKYPKLAGAGALRIEIDATAPSFWAFVSVTNNNTQHVTVISPQ